MNPIILGPVPCKGCRFPVYWGLRRLRDGTVTGDRRWREPSDGMPHVCLGGIK